MLYRKCKFNWFARPLRPAGNATWRCGICAERQCLSFPKVSLSLRSCSFGSFISSLAVSKVPTVMWINFFAERIRPGAIPVCPWSVPCRWTAWEGWCRKVSSWLQAQNGLGMAWGLQVLGVTTCTFHYIPPNRSKLLWYVTSSWKSRACPDTVRCCQVCWAGAFGACALARGHVGNQPSKKQQSKQCRWSF